MSEEKVLVPSIDDLMAAFAAPQEVDTTASAFEAFAPPPETVPFKNEKNEVEFQTWFYGWKLKFNLPTSDEKRRASAITHVPGWEKAYPDLDHSVSFNFQKEYENGVGKVVRDSAGRPVMSGFTQDLTLVLQLPGDRFNNTYVQKYLSTVVQKGRRTSQVDTWIRYILNFLPEAQRVQYAPAHKDVMSPVERIRLLRILVKLDPTILAPIQWVFKPSDYKAAQELGLRDVRGAKHFEVDVKGGKEYRPLKVYSYTVKSKNGNRKVDLDGMTGIDLYEEGFEAVLSPEGGVTPTQVLQHIQEFQGNRNPREITVEV